MKNEKVNTVSPGRSSIDMQLYSLSVFAFLLSPVFACGLQLKACSYISRAAVFTIGH